MQETTIKDLIHMETLYSDVLTDVSIVCDKHRQKEFVLKKVNFERHKTNTHIPTEISFLKHLHEHNVPGVNKMYDYHIESQECASSIVRGEYWILLEKKDMDLHEYVCYYKQLPEDEVKSVTKQIVSILKGMHTKANLIHMDLKLENILIDRNTNKIELCDFDFCVPTDVKRIKTDTYGTDMYAAPELFAGICYPTKSIVWSIGVVVYLMVHTELPWTKYKGLANVNSLVFDKHVSNDYVDFVMSCLQPDVTKRFDITQLESISWLK